MKPPEALVVGHLDIGQARRLASGPCAPRRSSKTAELAAVAHRPAHLPGRVRGRSRRSSLRRGDPGEHEVDALAEEGARPSRIGRLSRVPPPSRGGVRG